MPNRNAVRRRGFQDRRWMPDAHTSPRYLPGFEFGRLPWGCRAPATIERQRSVPWLHLRGVGIFDIGQVEHFFERLRSVEMLAGCAGWNLVHCFIASRDEL